MPTTMPVGNPGCGGNGRVLQCSGSSVGEGFWKVGIYDFFISAIVKCMLCGCGIGVVWCLVWCGDSWIVVVVVVVVVAVLRVANVFVVGLLFISACLVVGMVVVVVLVETGRSDGCGFWVLVVMVA